MTDIIQLLPDSIANQIAAGEVIQRPASVVKELVENAIDAGATNIQIVIKDAGRTLIQIIDNGKGMSATDARLAFERHATSKIKTADDLFSLHTMGFRGEALASIAAIAHVELKTRQPDEEIGTYLEIKGSRLEKQEITTCAAGTNISVKNIFFNVPARRKFLKSNEVERRNIFVEIERIALVNPEIEFSLTENEVQTLLLPISNLRQRIVHLEGKNINQQLIEIEEETSLAKIFGYVANPQYAKKGRAKQFFFVNNRYIRHPYFHKALMTAYEPLLSANENPNYFIYFQVNPDAIDVNIHPTKTEVKFENEQSLWQILMVTIKEALGRFNAIPSIDFDTADAPEIPIFDPTKTPSMPKVSLNPNYNPFGNSVKKEKPTFDWETLYKGFEKEKESQIVSPQTENELFTDSDTSKNALRTAPEHYQYKNKYILTSVKSGLMLIDQRRAHIRILFERFIQRVQDRKGASQRLLFPEILEFNNSEALALQEISDDLEALGFEINNMGNNAFAVHAMPSEINNLHPASLIKSLIDNSIDTGLDVKSEIREKLALSMANFAAIPSGKSLSEEEMLLLVSQLLACKIPNHTPDGKTIISVIPDEEMDKRMK